MRFKTIFVCTIFCLLVAGCTKENSTLYKAEGNVYEVGTSRGISNIPVIMSECDHTGTRCVYTTIATTYTDGSGHYKISGRRSTGSINIEVGFNDKTYGTPEVNRFRAGEVFYHDFFVEMAAYVSARFILQTQNRNYAILSLKTGPYSNLSAIRRNPPAVWDTTMRFRFAPGANGAQILQEVFLRNEIAGNPPYSDTLNCSRNLGMLRRDTSVVWIVP